MRLRLTAAAAFLFLLLVTANAGWRSVVGGFANKNLNSNISVKPNSSGVTYQEKKSALRQALEFGVKNAVSNLSKTNGFLDNPHVKIPVPGSLKTAAKILKSVGQGHLVNNFVAEMNHAAEKAAPKTINIFMRAIKKMSIKDAAKILTGPDNAATEYFKKNTHKDLFKAIKPIVKRSTSKTKATKYYKNIIMSYKKYEKPLNGISSYKNLLSGKKENEKPVSQTDLDSYITQKAMDGIFFMISEEEKKIRENPLARSTTLLKKVFGSL